MKKRTLQTSGIALILAIALMRALGAQAAESAEIVSFFKQVVVSAPTIRHFRVVQRQWRWPSMPPAQAAALKNAMGTDSIELPRDQVFDGARCGNNFFVRIATPNDASVPSLTYGRSGGYFWKLPKNAPGNSTTCDHVEKLMNQMFQMGVGNLKPEGVVWDGLGFKAECYNAPNAATPIVTKFGELTLSNGLPDILKISAKKGGYPFVIYRYTYPTPAGALGGYPLKISILKNLNDPEPQSEWEIQQCETTTTDLPDSFFASAKFTDELPK